MTDKQFLATSEWSIFLDISSAFIKMDGAGLTIGC